MDFLLLISLLSGDVTYSKVQPIFKERCASCHNENWADKNWMDIKVARANADKIKLRVEQRTMPPGNLTGMTDEERELIKAWVNNGSK